MNRILKRIADDQQLTDLQQKGQQIQQIFSSVNSELQQVIPMLQDPLLQSNGSLIGIDTQTLSDSINSFLEQINSISNS